MYVYASTIGTGWYYLRGLRNVDLVFTLYDVSIPENCVIEGLAMAGSTQVEDTHQDDNRGSGSCQF